jgi:hypothetical protein
MNRLADHGRVSVHWHLNVAKLISLLRCHDLMVLETCSYLFDVSTL